MGILTIEVNDLAPDLPRADLFRLVARVRFLSTEEGGRISPVASGYRPDCWFGLTEDGERLLHGCHLHFRAGADAYEDKGTLWVRPGESCKADVLVRYPSSLRGVAVIGGSFEVHEGRRVVGRGEVEAIHDPGPGSDP